MSNAGGSVKLRTCNSSLNIVFAVFPMKRVEQRRYVLLGKPKITRSILRGRRSHKLQIRN